MTKSNSRYEVIESLIMQHPDGRKASIYGSHPGEGFELVSQGWTVRDNISGTVGLGRVPWETREEAQAFVDNYNHRWDNR